VANYAVCRLAYLEVRLPIKIAFANLEKNAFVSKLTTPID